MSITNTTTFNTIEEAVQSFSPIIKEITTPLEGKLDEAHHIIVEAALNDYLKDSFKPGITTAQIFKQLINKASMLCSNVDNTFWGLIAGRLRNKEFIIRENPYQNSLRQHITEMVKTGVYGAQVETRLSIFTPEEFALLNSELKPELDYTFNSAAMLTALNKYLRPFKNPKESLQQMFMVNAMIIASNERNAQKRLDFVLSLYEKLSTRKLSLATPWMANLRGDGNISSCFIIEVGDSLLSLIDSWSEIARISKEGGGVGVFMGNIRAKGAPVKNIDNASKGINSWARIINDIASTVDQGGIRKGAVTVALPIWHNDIEDFLELQTEVGDLRTKAFDIFPQVTTPNLFWQRCEENGLWYTFCPTEVKKVLGFDIVHTYGADFEEKYAIIEQACKDGTLKIFTEYKAKNLAKHQMRTQLETGMPYIAYTDRINESNPNRHKGFIPCVNLCTESFSVTTIGQYSHCCNLASLVMSNINSSKELEDVTRVATRVLDYGIGLTNPPTDTTAAHNNAFRTIGIGITGLHDFLAKRNWQFTNAQLMGAIAKQVEYFAIDESISLAKEYAPFPEFKNSMWDDGSKIDELVKYTSQHRRDGYCKEILEWQGEDLIEESDFIALQLKINKYGIRNSQLTSPAPNTGTSVFTESSASILPIYSAFFIETNREGLKPQYGAFVNENPLHYARTFPMYDSKILIDYVSEMQWFIDTGISFELIFDRNKPNVNAKTIYDTYVYAWKKGLKSVYYMRTIKPGNTLLESMALDASETCVGCKN